MQFASQFRVDNRELTDLGSLISIQSNRIGSRCRCQAFWGQYLSHLPQCPKGHLHHRQYRRYPLNHPSQYPEFLLRQAGTHLACLQRHRHHRQSRPSFQFQDKLHHNCQEHRLGQYPVTH